MFRSSRKFTPNLFKMPFQSVPSVPNSATDRWRLTTVARWPGLTTTACPPAASRSAAQPRSWQPWRCAACWRSSGGPITVKSAPRGRDHDEIADNNLLIEERIL